MIRGYKIFISFILLFAFSLQIGAKCIIWANYLINKKEIISLFCANKSKPKMNCNGKCHLKKQLQKQEEQEQSPVSSIKEIKEIQLFYASQKALEVSSVECIQHSSSNFKYTFHLSSEHLQAVFHPPLV
jgi:hypothetical protein